MRLDNPPRGKHIATRAMKRAGDRFTLSPCLIQRPRWWRLFARGLLQNPALFPMWSSAFSIQSKPSRRIFWSSHQPSMTNDSFTKEGSAGQSTDASPANSSSRRVDRDVTRIAIRRANCEALGSNTRSGVAAPA